MGKTGTAGQRRNVDHRPTLHLPPPSAAPDITAYLPYRTRYAKSSTDQARTHMRAIHNPTSASTTMIKKDSSSASDRNRGRDMESGRVVDGPFHDVSGIHGIELNLAIELFCVSERASEHACGHLWILQYTRAGKREKGKRGHCHLRQVVSSVKEAKSYFGSCTVLYVV
jgi:hypothetical protein